MRGTNKFSKKVATYAMKNIVVYISLKKSGLKGKENANFLIYMCQIFRLHTYLFFLFSNRNLVKEFLLILTVLVCQQKEPVSEILGS